MKKIFFLTFFLLFISKLNAQNSNSYAKFTLAQIAIAKKIATEKLATEIIFNQGVEYQGKNFWFVTSKNNKKHYFNSNESFTKVIYTEEDYHSLMEYIIEESDF
ncbi:hypothetical protein [Tenacibaculum aestuariivivum]|uniref:hypothetical protein n=1 Tax=Tenacibaculum aestuariivivum TaxID=2006131 RepID=UPI003AB6C6BD